MTSMRRSNEVLLLHALAEYNTAILHITTWLKGTCYLCHKHTKLALGNIPSILIGIFLTQCRLSSGCFIIKWKAESENMKIHGYYSKMSGSSRPLLVIHSLEDTTSPDEEKKYKWGARTGTFTVNYFHCVPGHMQAAQQAWRCNWNPKGILWHQWLR